MQDFEYWPWWRKLVKEHGISPNDAWSMDIVEIQQLEENQTEAKQDSSMMINAIRQANGMPLELIKNKVA